MRHWALPLLLLAGAIALLPLLLGGPRQHEKEPADNGASVTGAAPAPGAAQQPAPSASSGQEPGGIERTDADPRTAPPPQDERELVEILVLRRADGSPVPGAEVLVLTLREEQEREAAEEFFLGASVDAFIEKFGVKHRADAAGVARVPPPNDDTVLMARQGTLFGLGEWREMRQMRGPGGRVPIEVEESPDLLIRVRDDAGRPVAGIMVALRVGSGDYFSFDLLRARTGEDGIGRIGKAAAFARLFSPMEGASHSAALATVLATAVAVPVDVANLPTEPIELVLPPHGSVRVLLRNPDGTPAQAPLLVALAKARVNPEDDDDWLAPGMPGFDALSGRTESGSILFERVGIGLSLQASAVFPGAPQASVARRPGPQRAGETVEIVLTEQRDYPILLAQAQDRDGRPLANQPLKVRFLMQDDQVDRRNDQETRTDASGRVRLALRPVAAEEQALAILWERPAADGLPELTARTALDQALRPGESELGIVRLLESPLLASGRVLDASGAPLVGARVVPMHQRVTDFALLDDVYLEADYERSRLTDLLGGFTLTGAWSEPELTLEVQADGHLSASVTVAPGATGVEIRLTSSFGLAGRLLADPGVDLSRLALQLQYLSLDAGSPPLGVSVDPDSGRFHLEGAPAGIADLVISAPGLLAGEGEILRLAGLQIGAAPPDPRLDPIDLRGKLHGCIVQARAAGGWILEDLQAWPAAHPEAVSYGWDGTVSLIAAAPLGEVVVTATGCRETRFTPLRPREEVELPAGLPVRISLDGTADAGSGFRLGVFLFPEDDPGSWTRGARALFGPGGADLLVARTGRFRVEFLVAPADADQPVSGWWNFAWVPRAEDEPAQYVEVLESGSAQAFRLAPPLAARVAEAAASLGSAEE